VAALVSNPPFRSTPESVATFRDRAVAAQVRAELLLIPGLDTPTIEVECREGVVEIGGAVFSAEWEERAAAIATRVAGVRRVACRSLEAAAGYIVAPPA
jgi:osmotically-inducible protein OsmY